MKKNTIFSLLVLICFILLNISIQSQQCQVQVTDVTFESSNSLTFDVYLKNNGTSNFIYSHGSYAWTIDPAFLNGGTPTFSLVAGYSDFSSGAYPPSALFTAPNIIRTSSNMPGSNGTILPGQILRLYRFRLQTSASAFTSSNFNLSWKNTTAPYTRLYSWDSGTGLPTEISTPQLILALPLLVEDFDYPAGDTLTNHGWSQTGTTTTEPITVASSGLTYTGYVSSGIGNAALVDNNGQDINKVFTAQTNGTVYAAFMVKVDNYLTSGTSNYFFHFGQGNPMNTSVFRGKVFAQKSGTTDLQFGLSFASNTPTLTAVNYSIGTTYLVVLKYQIVSGLTNDSVSMFIFSGSIPANEPLVPTIGSLTETTGDLADVDAIALRQFNATENVVVDGIRVATAWEDLFALPSGPALSVLPATLSSFSYSVTTGGPSASQSYDLSGTNLTSLPGNITVTGSTHYEVSLNNSAFSSSVDVAYTSGTLSATPIYVRLKAGLPGGTYDAELIANSGGGATTQNVTCNGAVSNLEPTNHVTSFAGVLGVPAYYYMNLSWIDATTGTLPVGYLIRGSSFNFDSIKVPIDGTPVVNGFMNYNVNQGIQAQVVSGLNAGTTYYFKIFPYSNSGTNINYKTDGSIPQFSLITAYAPSLPLIENFEYATGSLLTSNGWMAHANVGINPITVKDTTLTYPDYLNSGLGKSVTLTTLGGEDDNRVMDTVSSGSVYASFMVNVTTAKTAGDYFFHLGTENTNFYYARVYVKKASNGNLSFGLSKTSTNTTILPSYSDSIYTEGTTYLIAVKYTFIADTSNDEVKLWINPVLDGTEPAANLTVTSPQIDATSLGMFALRQGGSSTAPALTLGGIRIAETWIPGSALTTFPLSVNVTDGWNMVSVPGVNPSGQGVNTWWSNRNLLADVYRWTTTYVPVTLTAPTQGYWMLHTGAQTYNYPAIQIVARDPIPLTAGWNMIGGYENTPLVSGLTTTPPSLIVPGTVYGWTGTYSNATNLLPGYGYWVLSTGNGVINSPTVADGSAKVAVQDDKSEWGKITITDASGKSYTLYSVNGEVNLNQYQMPPLPPTGMFDVRYGSNRKAENLKENNQTIEMRGLVYPVTVRAEKMGIKIEDETGKMVSERLKSGEEVTITNSSVSKLMVSADLIPDVYALEQNYPNPFNPSTKIEFSIPEDVNNVTLTIYNALGQRVTELVNSKLEAGKYSYVWNASDVATGLYIYELRTDKFVSVKKMMLLK